MIFKQFSMLKVNMGHILGAVAILTAYAAVEVHKQVQQPP